MVERNARIYTMRHRILIAAAAVVAALVAARTATAAVVSGHVDDFETGGVLSWQGGPNNLSPPTNISSGGPAGADDNYMRLTSNGSFGAGGRLVIFNQNQWTGDYLAANVGSIRMQVNNLGATDLALRLILLGPFGQQNLATQTSAAVPAGSGWNTITFSLASANLTGGDFGSVMSAVRELNLLHSPSAVLDRRETPPIAAQLGIDNITAVSAAPATPTWNVDASGNWTQATNWAGGVPNAAGATAVLGSVITTQRTVTVDAPISVGRLDFDNANAYTIAGTNALTLDATTGGARINVSAGSHTISAPLQFADATVFNVAPANGSLSITHSISADAFSITKLGHGTLTTGSISASQLSVGEGAVVIKPGSGVSELNFLRFGTLAPPPINDVQAVPEPTSAVLLVIGLAAAVGAARNRVWLRKQA